MAKAKSKIADDVVPSDALKVLARKEAKALGHSLGWWEEKTNGCWSARCTACYRAVSVISAMLTKDGMGRGGKGLREFCVVGESE